MNTISSLQSLRKPVLLKKSIAVIQTLELE